MTFRSTVNGTPLTMNKETVSVTKEWVKTDAKPGGTPRSGSQPRVAGQSTTPSNANNYPG